MRDAKFGVRAHFSARPHSKCLINNLFFTDLAEYCALTPNYSGRVSRVAYGFWLLLRENA
jgi:hypothetical protein